MKYPCATIKDLLPLYHDGVCSESSKEIVAAHLSECADCKVILQKIADKTYDDNLRAERTDVVGHYAQNMKRKSLIAGICIASILAVPILVCLIVNLATGHALDWFFIVLSALLVLASVTAVPLIVEEKKGLWTLGSFSGSLFLLLLVCCLYSGGDWFFVATIPILFGLSLLFLPFVLHQLPLQGFAARHRGLITMTADSLLLFAVVVIGGLYSKAADNWGAALLTTSFCLLLPWALFSIIRYGRGCALVKAGLCVLCSGLVLSVFDDILNWIANGRLSFSLVEANLFVWDISSLVHANVSLLLLLSGCIVGGALLAAGLLRGKIKT